MVENTTIKRRLSASAARKARNSRLWSERTQYSNIINENANSFVSQKNIRIVILDESKSVGESFSTIVSSKGKIVID